MDLGRPTDFMMPLLDVKVESFKNWLVLDLGHTIISFILDSLAIKLKKTISFAQMNGKDSSCFS